MPTQPERSTPGGGVELIERDAFQVADVTTTEPVQRDGALGAAAVVASLAAVVLALALIAQPAGSPPGGGEATTTTRIIAPATASTAPVPVAASGAGGSSLPQVATEQPIPPFDGNVPSGLPGVIGAVDADGSIIVIDRAQPGPIEVEAGLTPDRHSPQVLLGLLGQGLIGLGTGIQIAGTVVSAEGPGGEQGEVVDLLRLAPDGQGGVLVVDVTGPTQQATLTPLRSPGAGQLRWEVDGRGPQVIGVWQDRLVLERANRVWLLDRDGGTELVAEGEVLAYDGRYLVRLVCPELGQCEILAGDPVHPDTYRAAVPETIGSLPLDAWGASVTVSPDGARLGASVGHGAVYLPAVIDLAAGTAEQLADGMNQQAPVAWSPDGEWLAYVYSDDVMVWNVTGSRSWRIPVNRDLQALWWRGAASNPG
jgi:hypothetical protein